MNETVNNSGGLPQQQLQVFNNEQFGQLRTSVDEQGNQWFCLMDLCSCLSLKNPSHVSERLEQDGIISNYITDSLGREQGTLFVSEENMYACIFQSRKKEAKVFQKWVFSVVLPELRKTGHFEVNSTMPTDMPRITNLADAFEYMAKQEREKLAQQKVIQDGERKILALEDKTQDQEQRLETARKIYKEERPKVAFADAYTASQDCELIGNFAKILAQNGVETGERKFYEYLRAKGYLLTKGEYYNRPSQDSTKNGWFVVESRTIGSGKGAIVKYTTKITPKGQQYFINLFLNKNNNGK